MGGERIGESTREEEIRDEEKKEYAISKENQVFKLVVSRHILT